MALTGIKRADVFDGLSPIVSGLLDSGEELITVEPWFCPGKPIGYLVKVREMI
jgi:hypothetical protein